MTIFLLTATVFDDRTILAWSTTVDGESCSVQHVGRASDQAWADAFGSMLETDAVRISVTDRRDSTYGRTFSLARKSQGFTSQAHLDAFYDAYDHQETCPACQGISGYHELSDGYQPIAKRCAVWVALDQQCDAAAKKGTR